MRSSRVDEERRQGQLTRLMSRLSLILSIPVRPNPYHAPSLLTHPPFSLNPPSDPLPVITASWRPRQRQFAFLRPAVNPLSGFGSSVLPTRPVFTLRLRSSFFFLFSFLPLLRSQTWSMDIAASGGASLHPRDVLEINVVTKDQLDLVFGANSLFPGLSLQLQKLENSTG